MATPNEVQQAMAEARAARLRARAAVRKLMRYLDVTDSMLAATWGLSRQAMNYRISGRTAMTDEDIEGFAAFFEVPADVLKRGPDDAIRWVLDHPEAARSLRSNPTVGSRKRAAQAA